MLVLWWHKCELTLPSQTNDSKHLLNWTGRYCNIIERRQPALCVLHEHVIRAIVENIESERNAGPGATLKCSTRKSFEVDRRQKNSPNRKNKRFVVNHTLYSISSNSHTASVIFCQSCCTNVTLEWHAEHQQYMLWMWPIRWLEMPVAEYYILIT